MTNFVKVLTTLVKLTELISFYLLSNETQGHASATLKKTFVRAATFILPSPSPHGKKQKRRPFVKEVCQCNSVHKYDNLCIDALAKTLGGSRHTLCFMWILFWATAVKKISKD